jgi:AraC-like DNA-binding protein
VVPSDAAELGVRTFAAGVLVAWAAGLALSDAPRRARMVGALFCLSAVGYAFNEHGATRALIGPLAGPLWLMSVAAVAWFWLFVRTLFEDRPADGRAFAVPAALTATGLLGWFGPDVAKPGVWIMHHVAELAISGHAAWLAARSWRADLVDARRRLRAGVLGAMTLFAGLLAAAQITVIVRPETEPPRLLIALVFASLALAGATAFLRARGDLLATDRHLAQPPPVSDTEDPVIARLRVQMEEEALWRREGLTIAELARAVGVAEHRLRQVINHRLGYRNFNRYINDHRITAAKAILEDAAQGDRTVAAIAFDLGYGSLGPFNRAFREATGASPTEWRRERLRAPVAEFSNPR